ncbi:MAG: DUF1566 domain-containing protein [Gammaproteobacteria bacterium]|nr:MAG: DUF1566 domain-containing protein [Gammaproteobacteria bacterium]
MLSWNDVDLATGFNAYWGTNPGIHPDNAASYDASATGVASPLTVPDLASGSTYYFVVTSTLGDAESSGSEEVSVTPIVNPLTKLDQEGQALAADAETWACVRDDRTGLVWEVKTDDGNLRDRGHTYSWYDPDVDTNGGVSGVINGGACFGSSCDTTSYVEAVNVAGMCGASDWRKPSIEALGRLRQCSNADDNPPELAERCADFDGSFEAPTIDTTRFPASLSGAYWSSSTSDLDADDARTIDFLTGAESVAPKSAVNALRLVRTDRTYLASRIGRSSTETVLQINDMVQPGSSFSLTITNNMEQTFEIKRFLFVNVDGVIAQTTDPNDLNGGFLEPGESFGIEVTVETAVKDEDLATVFELAKEALEIELLVVNRI